MNTLLPYTPTPIARVDTATTRRMGIALYLKREDMNHPLLSGNKWWKLKYNVLQAQKERHDTLLTFGGAYSNHLYATAVAAHYAGMRSIGVVRGARALPLSPTLRFVQRIGMHLSFVSREGYRRKASSDFIAELRARFGRFYLIPEGGTNSLAIQGCQEFAKRLFAEKCVDYVCVPVGTGGTLVGLIRGGVHAKIVGFSSLKGGGFLRSEVRRNVPPSATNWAIETRYHFGGYGKTSQELDTFIHDFECLHGIPLEHVYTGKMMYGIFDLLRQGFFPARSRILGIHTGGLQGRQAGP